MPTIDSATVSSDEVPSGKTCFCRHLFSRSSLYLWMGKIFTRAQILDLTVYPDIPSHACTAHATPCPPSICSCCVQASTSNPGLLQKLGRVLKEKAAGDVERFFKGTTKTRERLGVGVEHMLMLLCQQYRCCDVWRKQHQGQRTCCMQQ